MRTNSLAVHYVSLHRSAVPESHLKAINDFDVQGAEPTVTELAYPVRPTPNILDAIREMKQQRVARVMNIMYESGSLARVPNQAGSFGIHQWTRPNR